MSLVNDVKSAKAWHVAIARELLQVAGQHEDVVDRLMHKVNVVLTCSKLPGDMPLRVRCTPNVFGLKA